MKKLLFLSLIVVLANTYQRAQAQVGINNLNPHKTAALDIKGDGKGVLFPNVNLSGRNTLAGAAADGLFLYDGERKFFYFRDTSIRQWVPVNPWKMDYNTNEVSLGDEWQNADIFGRGSLKLGASDAYSEFSTSYSYWLENYIHWRRVPHLTISTASLRLEGDLIVEKSLTANSIYTDNTITTDAEFVGYGTIPIGGIIMWSGTSAPDGWALCNGQVANGYTTPDLRGQFIVGYDPSNPDYSPPGNLSLKGNTVGKTGGEEKHLLTIAEMPRHTHGMFDQSIGGGSDWRVLRENARGENYDETYDLKTQGEGGSQAHENRPPYYALAFIMRIK